MSPPRRPGLLGLIVGGFAKHPKKSKNKIWAKKQRLGLLNPTSNKQKMAGSHLARRNPPKAHKKWFKTIIF